MRHNREALVRPDRVRGSRMNTEGRMRHVSRATREAH